MHLPLLIPKELILLKVWYSMEYDFDLNMMYSFYNIYENPYHCLFLIYDMVTLYFLVVITMRTPMTVNYYLYLILMKMSLFLQDDIEIHFLNVDVQKVYL